MITQSIKKNHEDHNDNINDLELMHRSGETGITVMIPNKNKNKAGYSI